MKQQGLNAVRLRLFLIIALFLITAVGIGLFTLGYRQLSEFSKETQAVAEQASASNSSLQKLVNTEKILEEKSDVVDRASLIVAESQSYVYQDQIISDLNRFAKEANISINNITFNEKTTATTGASAAPAQQPTATADPATGGATTTTGGSPGGVSSVTATITLNNPIPYPSMLKFIYLVEKSLFKMRISSLSLSHASDGESANAVNSNALTVEVYVR